MIFIGYWKTLVLNFSEMRNTVFFGPKSWWKDDIYWLLKSSCFELFGDGKYGRFLSQKVDGKMIFTNYWKVLVLNFSVMGNTVFFSQKVDGKMIFTWSFWAFYDIPELEKYGFSCSVPLLQLSIRRDLLGLAFIWFLLWSFETSRNWRTEEFQKESIASFAPSPLTYCLASLEDLVRLCHAEHADHDSLWNSSFRKYFAYFSIFSTFSSGSLISSIFRFE